MVRSNYGRSESRKETIMQDKRLTILLMTTLALQIVLFGVILFG